MRASGEGEDPEGLEYPHGPVSLNSVRLAFFSLKEVAARLLATGFYKALECYAKHHSPLAVLPSPAPMRPRLCQVVKNQRGAGA
jgi:hypothetical protein